MIFKIIKILYRKFIKKSTKKNIVIFSSKKLTILFEKSQRGLRGGKPLGDGVAENAEGGWNEGETSPNKKTIEFYAQLC